MTIEAQVARQIAHREHISQVLARTGGEVIHPDHYDLREAIRNAVLSAIDEATTAAERGKMSDAELPALFRATDAIAERVWLKSVGVAA
jgi:hypothetical protein